MVREKRGQKGADRQTSQGGAVRSSGFLQFLHNVSHSFTMKTIPLVNLTLVQLQASVHDVQWLGDAGRGNGCFCGIFGIWRAGV